MALTAFPSTSLCLLGLLCKSRITTISLKSYQWQAQTSHTLTKVQSTLAVLQSIACELGGLRTQPPISSHHVPHGAHDRRFPDTQGRVLG